MSQDTVIAVNAAVSEDPNMIRYAIPYKEYIVYLQNQVKASDSVLHAREMELIACRDEVRTLDKNLSANSIVPLLTNGYGVIIVAIIALVILFVINSKRSIKIGKDGSTLSIEAHDIQKKGKKKDDT